MLNGKSGWGPVLDVQVVYYVRRDRLLVAASGGDLTRGLPYTASGGSGVLAIECMYIVCIRRLCPLSLISLSRDRPFGYGDPTGHKAAPSQPAGDIMSFLRVS